MARLARGEYIHPDEIQTVHICSRTVRQSYLCGFDPYTNQSYEHRRDWIRKRLEFLASIFGIDCLTYAVMSNHLHVVLRSRPDIVKSWSDQEVARRWMTLFPKTRKKRGSDEIPPPTEAQIDSFVKDREKMGKVRRRLSDISWWMRCTAENISRRANQEDGCSGHFWSERFKAQLLLDEASILACAAYVDLNPVRAAMAKSLETSTYTGICDRIEDLKETKRENPASFDGASENQPGKSSVESENTRAKMTHHWERSSKQRRSGWLSPIEIRETSDPSGPDGDESGRRASRKGFLPISLIKYLELLEWTGRQIAQGKRGKIPPESEPILDKLGLASSTWSELVKSFGHLFHRAVGKEENLQQEAARRGQKRFRAPGLGLMFGRKTTLPGSQPGP